MTEQPPRRLNSDGVQILQYGIANGWLSRWFDTHMALVSGAPMAPEAPHCPGCDGPAHNVSLGREYRGWFTVWPCRCGFEIEPILGPDSPFPYVGPTTFISFERPECEVPDLSPESSAAVLRAAREFGVEP